MAGTYVETLDDTIVACATPPGEGAIAIVRLSGSAAICIGAQVAPSRRERIPRVMTRCVVRSRDGMVIDDAMAVEMRGPRSYTGQDVVELYVHGSRGVVLSVLEHCRALGARQAGPGEFTLRAFLNGRVDLAQAEAVSDLIRAGSEGELGVAVRQLRGDLSERVQSILVELEGVLAEWRAALDFPEHDSGADVSDEQWQTLRRAADQMAALIRSGRVRQKSGYQVVLCGAPNVGKSTLVNAWAGELRALVDAEPGTTRDAIEVDLTQRALRWSVWDTAGIRSDAGGVEARGIELTLRRARQSDLVLWLVCGPASSAMWPPEGVEGAVVVGSKSDLVSASERQLVEGAAAQRSLRFLGWVSGLTGEGVEVLRGIIEDTLTGDLKVQDSDALVVRQRHLDCLVEASEALERLALCGAGMAATLDVMSIELESAAKSLGRIMGRDIDAEVLERIFADFCIGK